MNAKRVLHSLLFILAAAASSLASAHPDAGNAKEAQASAFPYMPVGSPNIE